MKNVTIILIALISTVSLSAQRGDNSRGGGEGKRMSMEERQAQELENLTKQLSLTSEQVVSITALQEKLSEEFEAMRADRSEGGDREQMREVMMQSREDYNNKVKALLTDEQKSIYEKILEKQEAAMKERGQRGPGGQRLN